jgi:predicted RNA methylase
LGLAQPKKGFSSIKYFHSREKPAWGYVHKADSADIVFYLAVLHSASVSRDRHTAALSPFWEFAYICLGANMVVAYTNDGDLSDAYGSLIAVDQGA